MEDISVDKLSGVYLKLRDQREALKRKYEEDDAILLNDMNQIEDALLLALREAEADSISTPTATVIRRVSKRYNPTNWDAVYKMIHKHQAYGLLHKRVHDTNMREFLDQNPDEYPAGLNVDSSYAVTVRRKSAT